MLIYLFIGALFLVFILMGFLWTAYESARRYAKVVRDAHVSGRLDVVFEIKRKVDKGTLMSKVVLHFMERQLGRGWAAGLKGTRCDN